MFSEVERSTCSYVLGPHSYFDQVSNRPLYDVTGDKIQARVNEGVNAVELKYALVIRATHLRLEGRQLLSLVLAADIVTGPEVRIFKKTDCRKSNLSTYKLASLRR